MIKMSDFEISVLNKFLEGQGKNVSMLRNQMQNLMVKNRQQSRSGVFIKFHQNNSIFALEDKNRHVIEGVKGFANNIKYSIGFILYLENGMIDMLEAYTYDETWPEQLDKLKLIREIECDFNF